MRLIKIEFDTEKRTKETVKTQKKHSFELVLKEMSADKGVRKTKNDKYESFVSNRGRFISLGTYNSKVEAIEVVVSYKINRFKEGVLNNGDDICSVIPSSEKGYFASPTGNVYNKEGHCMIGAIGRDGYRHIITNNKNVNVHRIIAKTFIDNPNNLPCVNHIDGNKQNNNVSNLEWCDHSYNTRHAYANGLEKRVFGEDHHSHKLETEDVIYIRTHYKKRDKKYGAVALSERFGVDRTTIHDIIRNKTWRDLKC